MREAERRLGPGISRSPLRQHPALPPTVRYLLAFTHTATGIRTRVSAVRGRRPSPLDDSGGAAMPNESVARLQGPMRLRWSDAQARIDGCWPRGGAAGSSARRGRRPGGRERRPRSRSACVHAPDPDGDTPPAVSRAGSASRSPADPRQLLTSPDPRLWRNLVDAHGSGPCGLTLVEVRVLSAASMSRVPVGRPERGPGDRRAAPRHPRAADSQPRAA
jgi:hypothetical protein